MNSPSSVSVSVFQTVRHGSGLPLWGQPCRTSESSGRFQPLREVPQGLKPSLRRVVSAWLKPSPSIKVRLYHSSSVRHAAAALLAAILLASSANAQRRVLTNEDVATAPPPAPAAATAEAPAPTVAPESSSAALPSTPLADLNRVKAIQKTLMELYDLFAVKAAEASDAELQKRWTDMNLSMGEVIRANQLTIDELQARLGIQPQPPEPEEPSEPPAPQSQAVQ